MPHDKQFLRWLHQLVFVMDREKLGTPLAIQYRPAIVGAEPPAIVVQVDAADFAGYMKQLKRPKVTTRPHDGKLHLRGESELLSNAEIRLHVVTVTDSLKAAS